MRKLRLGSKITLDKTHFRGQLRTFHSRTAFGMAGTFLRLAVNERYLFQSNLTLHS